MECINYSLKIEDKILIEDLNISFEKNIMNHLLGSNGVGKSCFAKSCIGMLEYNGKINAEGEIRLIGSYSNVPLDFRLKDIMKILYNRFNKENIKYLYKILKLNNISDNIPIRKLSDGQKQKIKLLSFLASEPKTIILDEFTSALDKKTTLEIYEFLRVYLNKPGVVCLNITHNLSDIEYMEGNYYYFNNNSIEKIETKSELVKLYMKG